ncbi:MAG: Stp1/IreP family PP2C-type Ser/Thr phosphatase [Pseudomonadota bacterium]
MKIKAAGITDVGLKRDGNEDFLSLDDSLGLYIVADGMGGHLAGEVASRIAVEMINESYKKWIKKEATAEEIFGPGDSSLTLRGNYISSSIKLANRVVLEMAKEYAEYHGMGTTVVVLLINADLIVAAHVGDSRIYMIRDGHMERLSKDHTLVSEQVEMGIMTPAEAETSPLRHVLTRNLGSTSSVQPEVYEIEPFDEDRFILCSDGLTDLVSDEEIFKMMQNEDEPERLCHQLIEKALQRGGHDNTTVVSVFLTEMKKDGAGPLFKLGQLLADLIIGIQKTIKKFIP